MAVRCPICGTPGHACGPATPVRAVDILEEVPAVAPGPRRRYLSPTGLPGAYILADDGLARALGLTGGAPAPTYRTPSSSTFLARTAALAARAEAAGAHPTAVANWRLTLEARLDPDELEHLETLDGLALAAATEPVAPASDPVEKPAHTGPPPGGAPAAGRPRRQTPPAAPQHRPPAPEGTPPMSTPLATVDELRTFMGGTVTFEDDTAELYLRLASGEVRAATGQTYDAVIDDTAVISGDGTRTLLLPEVPVTAVTALVDLTGPLEAPVPATTWEWSEHGIIRRIDTGRWARRYRAYRVTYDHGYGVIPDVVTGVVLRMAARVIDNPEGIKQEGTGRWSMTRAGESAGIGLLPADWLALEGYTADLPTRRRAVG